MPKAKKDKIMFYGTGRRKSSIARVRLVEGTGVITINGKNIEEYLGTDTLKVIVRQPLTATNTLDKYDVILYDEPLEGLDEEAIKSFFGDLKKRSNTVIVMSIHEIPKKLKINAKKIFIKDGKLCEE